MACMQLQVVVLLVVLSLWRSKWQLSGSLGTRLMSLYYLYLLLNVVRAPSQGVSGSRVCVTPR